MKKIQFLYIEPRGKVVTGGQKYEYDLRETISSSDRYEVSCGSLIQRRSVVNKILAPFIGIYKAFVSGKYSLVFLNSASCLYLIPFVLLRRLFVRKKVLIIHHHFIYLEFRGIKRYVYQFFEYLFLKSASTVVTPSPYIQKELTRRGIKKILLWPIPFDFPEREKASPVKGNLVYMGTIEPRKGLHFLFESLVMIDPDKYRLSIIGKVVDRNYYESLMELANKKHLNVKFEGFVTEEEKDRIFREADIFVFPSLLEGFGIVLVEAQSYGLPIVCFDNSAMSMTVHHDKNGLLCRTGDTRQFAENCRGYWMTVI